MEFWLVETFDAILVIGAIYREFISGHNPLTYLALAIVPMSAFLLYRVVLGSGFGRWRGPGCCPRPACRLPGCAIGR